MDNATDLPFEDTNPEPGSTAYLSVVRTFGTDRGLD
ncbi:hypothetical protein C7451_1343 [Blastomonas natatoria]|uniref:Uncharacterized protein n=1 Tax=Blastomonas natatoria TaxID=34015 RepID=A0A2V3V1T6_9SPHN|nr:hypothetical protein C7451_1343 [Blastomonas natatoria]